MAKKLPIKTRILEWCIENDRPITAKQLSKILAEEYQHEKTTTIPNIEKQMLCYCRVGMLDPVGLDESSDPPYIQYQITEAGKEEAKYIPGHGNKYF